MVLGVNLLYELALVFLLFQDLDSARGMMTLLDPALGVPLPEKSYAEDCTLGWATIWVGLPIRFDWAELILSGMYARTHLTCSA